MADADMSPRAVTARLVRTAQLRRLCLLLGRRRAERADRPRGEGPPQPGPSASPGPDARDR